MIVIKTVYDLFISSNEIQGNNDIQLKWNYNMLLPKYQYNFKKT